MKARNSSIISLRRGNLSMQKVIDLAIVYLENAEKLEDPDIRLLLCYDAELSLSQVKKTAKLPEDKAMSDRVADAYWRLGDLMDDHNHKSEAQAFHKKAEKWGDRIPETSQPTEHTHSTDPEDSVQPAPQSATDTSAVVQSPNASQDELQPSNTAMISQEIFLPNACPFVINVQPPKDADIRLKDTLQLACCLGLLQSSIGVDDIPDLGARTWLKAINDKSEEEERLMALATGVIRVFKNDKSKDSKAVTEVAHLAHVLEKDDFRNLVNEFISGIDDLVLLDVHQLDGLAHLIQGAKTGYLVTDDLVKILEFLSTRLTGTHQQSTEHLYPLTMAVSRVLDAMVDAGVEDVDREKLHQPLSSYLDELQKSSHAYLVYQAAYAYQALLCVPDNETLVQATIRRTGKVMQGVFGLVSAVKGLDVNGFIEGLGKIQEGANEILQVAKTVYDGAKALKESGQGFLDCLKEGLSFERKRAWYTALRGADLLIRDGHFTEFRDLVYEVPCRRDVTFQWGLCQRLGEIAASPKWDAGTRRDAITFLGEIYRNNQDWDNQAIIKQWIVDILLQLTTLAGCDTQSTQDILSNLQKDGDAKRQTSHQARKNSTELSPIVVTSEAVGNPSLLDRVQERTEVEGSLRQLKKQRMKEREQRLKERGEGVYISPQAKANLQTRDDVRFTLMNKVDEFIESDQKVFLLLGDSGAGKSTFVRELEGQLWDKYKGGSVIPLFINLPAIDKPEYDMIAKQLRKAEFTEPQIRELKINREFILICDGYDESQQTQNLYTCNRLNQPGEWSGKMLISCRSEYLGNDYQYRFQPGDRNHQADSGLFQEAVVTSFSAGQVEAYISAYVKKYQPLWKAEDYENALKQIPSLNDLVKNPFLMSLSLDVLPRMIDLGKDISAVGITRTALYDQFIEHWLERGKKRLQEKALSPQARAAFESLIDEGFTRNGIDYLKKLCATIYKEQSGQPIVTYSRYKDEGSWKSEFFGRDDEKQLLREASPLTRNGNQHRFIHRSLLEYGVALAIFDPQDWKERPAPESTLARRGSVSSVMSSDEQEEPNDISPIVAQKPPPESPLTWRSFVKEPSVLQFLEERVQQEGLFKQQLLGYIELSKEDKKWRTAAANAITILVRAGVQFNGAKLQGIQIPKANLSSGVFDSAQLQGADLRYVNFRGAWLRGANLSNALMTGVQFGELPFLEQDSKVELCTYSPDGNTFAVGLSSGKINVYSTSTWDILRTHESNGGRVASLVFSPTSSQLASADRNFAVRLWGVGAESRSHILTGHSNWIKGIVYSPHGHRVASASADKTLKLWDVETGACRLTFTGHTDCVTSVDYSSRGNQIASSSNDGTVRLWSTDTEECSRILSDPDNNSWVTSVRYSPQGNQVTSVSWDETMFIWDVDKGDLLYTLAKYGNGVTPVMYSPNGQQVASANVDKAVLLWNIKSGEGHTLLGHTSEITSVAYSHLGDLVVSASSDKSVRLWDADTGVCHQILTDHSESVSSAAFSPNGDQIASGSYDKTVRLWEVRAGKPRHVSSGHSSNVQEVVCSPNGGQVASLSDDKTVRLWDMATGRCHLVLQGDNEGVSRVVYSPRGDQIAIGSVNGEVQQWNVETGARFQTMRSHSAKVNSIAYSPQGDQLASASDDYEVRLWDVGSGYCRFTLTGHTGPVSDVVYSPAGTCLASCSEDTTVRLWDVKTGVCIHIFGGHTKPVYMVVYSPQGDQVASASEDTTVRLWDVKTGKRLHIFGDRGKPVYCVTYSPNGGQIVSGSQDGTVQLWNTESGEPLWTLTGHSGQVNSIVYSPQGDMVASASSDKSIRLWNVVSGQCQAVIDDFQARINDIAWIMASGGNFLAAACGDGVVGVWQLMTDDEVRLCWRTRTGELNVKTAIVQHARGLSKLDKLLLKQLGAIGDPASRFQEAGKKVTTMLSVVSELKGSSDTALMDPVLSGGASVEQLERWLEQSRSPLCQDIVAAIVKSIHGYK